MSCATVFERPAPRWTWEAEDEVVEEPRVRPALRLVASQGQEQAASPDRSGEAPSVATTAAEFDLFADQLALDGAGVSAPWRLAKHPAYVGILAMGRRAAVPLLLERLKQSGGRPIWLSLLGSLTGRPPGLEQETIDAAAAEWIAWSKQSARDE